MADWSKYPFVRMLIPTALGIWCAVVFPMFRLPFIVVAFIMLALCGLTVATNLWLKTYRFQWLFGAIMGCYLFFGGYALTHAHEDWKRKDYFRCFETDAKCYVARVCDYPSERESVIRMPLELEYQFGDSLHSRTVTGKVMAYFRKSNAAFALRYGDLVAIDAPIGEVSPPKNPGEFDYRSYLLRKGITGQIFLSDDNFVDLQTNKANPIVAFSFRFRDKLLASLQRCGISGDEFGVAAAILLGYDDNLADEVRKHYVAAGSMHILCVSGMHVGIVYLLASFLLSFLNCKKWQKWLKQFLLLSLIWLYALISGFSPSVLRASLMLSFVIIGELMHRKGFIINSIAASAFILLCANPNNLFDIGFQLSYSAVVGIVVLQKPIYNLLYVRNKLLDRAWEITAVALAAQLATIPFTLFYFNQFTTYFWLSNLLMTPISFVVVISGMLLLMVSWIPYLNVLVGYMVWGMVFLMNAVVSWVERLPLSIIDGLYITDFEFVMLLLAFLMLLLTVALRRQHILIGVLSALLLFMVSLTVRVYSSGQQDEMIAYSLSKHTAVDFVRGGRHVLLADSTLMTDESAIDYSLKGAWIKQNLSLHPDMVGLDDDFEGPFLRKKQNLVSFDGKLLALWDGQHLDDSLSYRLPVDYLLVTGKQHPDVQSVVEAYDIKMLLIDGSVPHYLANEWMEQAEKLGTTCFNIGVHAFLPH